jgi:hypothetical protein
MAAGLRGRKAPEPGLSHDVVSGPTVRQEVPMSAPRPHVRT